MPGTAAEQWALLEERPIQRIAAHLAASVVSAVQAGQRCVQVVEDELGRLEQPTVRPDVFSARVLHGSTLLVPDWLAPEAVYRVLPLRFLACRAAACPTGRSQTDVSRQLQQRCC